MLLIVYFADERRLSEAGVQNLINLVDDAARLLQDLTNVMKFKIGIEEQTSILLGQDYMESYTIN